MNSPSSFRLAAVAIGRNEGPRLRACLASIKRKIDTIVYVDSGSRDDSVAHSRSVGVDVVELDMTVPFTAARARNVGWRRIASIDPGYGAVLFIDGDCELVDGFLPEAIAELDSDRRIAIVCGRVKERHPEMSIYNRLCDLEWQGPTGDVDSSGGNALVRMAALKDSGGFDDTLIAGEEPELCYRLRRANWRIRRIPQNMVLHDASMFRFMQWWRRCERSGHAYTEQAFRYGRHAERPGVRETISNLGFGLGAGLCTIVPALTAVVVPAYALMAVRIYHERINRGWSSNDSWIYAVGCMAAKLPQAVGTLRFAARQWRGRPRTLIEYK